jgi:SH3 domain-containing YSC84-like protein 1
LTTTNWQDSNDFLGCCIFLAFAVLLGACSMVASGHDGLQRDGDQAVAIIERFEAIPEKAIPPAVMRAARGVAILTVTKVGFIGSVRGGTGIVVSRTDKGWGGPSAIGTGGIGAGLQAGAEVSELVIVLNTPAAVDAFAKGGNVTLSTAAVGAAAGPVGRTAEAGVAPQAAMHTYSRSQAFSPASPWKVR